MKKWTMIVAVLLLGWASNLSASPGNTGAALQEATFVVG